LGHFLAVTIDHGASLGWMSWSPRPGRERGVQPWADPRGARPGEINHNDGGHGLYFQDPSGHYLEIITRPYGSGG
jgi:hypothetical protein